MDSSKRTKPSPKRSEGSRCGHIIHSKCDTEPMAMLNAGFAAVEAKVGVPAENAMAIDRASAGGIVTYAKIRKVVDLVMGTGVKRGKIRLMLG